MLAALLGAAAPPGGETERLYRAGVEAFQSGRTLEALEALTAVAARDSGYRDVQLLLGQACLASNLLRPAKSHFEAALAATPGNGHAAFLLGLTLYQGARYFEAAEALSRAHDLAATNPHPLIYRGLSNLRLGRPDRARSDLDRALALAPDDVAARLGLAELALAEGRVAEAEALARRAGGDAPSNVEAQILLGRILLDSDRADEAAPVLGRALAGGSARSDALYLFAQALLRSGETAAGRRALSRFQDHKALEERVRLLEAALASDPQDLETRVRLARELLAHDRRGAALIHLATLRRQAPDDSRVRDLLNQAGGRR